MAFDYTLENEWKEAFNVDFFCAFILAIFLFLNGLALTGFIHHKSSNTIGFFNNSDEQSSETVYDICFELVNQEEALNQKENSKNTSIDTDLISQSNHKFAIKFEPNNTKNISLNTVIPNLEFASKNQKPQAVFVQSSITSESYLYPATWVATQRIANVRNTTHTHLNTNTSHTFTQAPRNKTFYKSEKIFTNDSKFNLGKLLDVRFLLPDLIKTTNLQGINIILSLGTKWCLPWL